MLRARIAMLVVVALLCAACIPPGQEVAIPSAEPLPELAVPATPLAPEGDEGPEGDIDPTSGPATPTEGATAAPDEPPAAPESDEPDPADPPTDDGADGAATAPDADPEPAPPAEPAPATQGQHSPPRADDRPGSAPAPQPTFAVLADVPDRPRDAGLEAPDYADLTRVLVESDGRRLRVTVEVDGDLPARLADGEVVGLGVDLFAPGSRESDHQLFADGGSDGWRAYLQTPEGFIAYPGTFGVGGRRVVFEVPWDGVGGLAPRETRTFLDWSRRRLPLNATSADAAPDRGRTSLSP